MTDANGCTKTGSYTISQPSGMSITATTTSVGCYGGSNGSINSTVTGGYSPYTYVWSNGSTAADPTSLAAGTYTVTVTDAHSCTRTASFTVAQPAALSVSPSATNVSCHGGSNGAITTTCTGGTPSCSYTWSTGSHFSNLSGCGAGTYSCTVTDAHGCTTTCSSTVTEPATALTSTLSCTPLYPVTGGSANTVYRVVGAQSVTLCGSAAGGASGYSYSWSSSSTCHTSTLSTAPGSTTTYSCTVTDGNGCTSTCGQTISVVNISSSGYGDGYGYGYGGHINICHYGSTISVDTSEWPEHYSHGDYLGTCEGSGWRTSNTDTGSGKTVVEVADDIIKVYPNPTDNVFNVAIPATDKSADMQVSDITGRIIERRSIVNNDGTPLQFSLGNMAPGIYFLKVNTGGRTTNYKINKQ